MSEGPSSPEERYFQEKEARLRQKLRDELERNAAEEQAKRQIADGLGTDDAALVNRIHALGLDGEVVHVIHLLPLVQVAWADGTIQSRERAAILRAVEAHGVAADSPGATFIASLLEQRPSDTLLEEVFAVLSDLIDARDMHPHSLIEACESVAGASGGLLGFGSRISAEERTLIERFAASVKPSAVGRVTERLGDS